MYQNTAEILALGILNVVCAVLGALQVVDGVKWLDRLIGTSYSTTPLAMAEKIEISLSVALLTFAIIMSYLSYQMSKQFGWNIYKKIGADVQIQSKLTNTACSQFCLPFYFFRNVPHVSILCLGLKN